MKIMKQRIIKTLAKQIYTRSKLPGIDWVINQYVGCEHSCSYCYARFMARWKKHGPWGCWVEAKMNAPELVKKKSVSGSVFMSSVSDAYQPIEKDLKLTRRILENIDKNTQLSILTKSNLVLRDRDLFENFKSIEIGFTINSFSGKEKELFEPGSSTNAERIEALKILKHDGTQTYAFVSPIIPGLFDFDYVLNNTKAYADSYFFEFINLRGAGGKFLSDLKRNYPDSYRILSNKKLLFEYVEALKSKIEKSSIKIRAIICH